MLHSHRFHPRLDPMRAWFTLLIVSVIALAAIIVWNAWAFDRVASGGTLGKAATTTPPAFSHASINTVRTIFEARAGEATNYTTGVYRYADPSQ